MKYKRNSCLSPNVPNGVLKLRFLHEKDMGNIQLPHFVLGAKLGRLEKQLLDQKVVLSLPVDACLGHEDGNITL